MLGLKREAELERRVGFLRRHLVRLLQMVDRLFAVAGIARHDAQEHVDPIVGRAGGLAGREQPLDLGRRARLLAEQALCLLDVAARLGIGGERDEAGGAGQHKQATDKHLQHSGQGAPRRRAHQASTRQ